MLAIVEIFKFIFFVYGAVILLQILLSATPLRYKKPLSCAACLSFWIGLVSCDLFLPIEGWMFRIEMAVIAAGTSWLLDGIVKGEK